MAFRPIKKGSPDEKYVTREKVAAMLTYAGTVDQDELGSLYNWYKKAYEEMDCTYFQILDDLQKPGYIISVDQHLRLFIRKILGKITKIYEDENKGVETTSEFSSANETKCEPNLCKVEYNKETGEVTLKDIPADSYIEVGDMTTMQVTGDVTFKSERNFTSRSEENAIRCISPEGRVVITYQNITTGLKGADYKIRVATYLDNRTNTLKVRRLEGK